MSTIWERPICVHTRVILAVVNHATFEYVVLTPDKDIYVEVLDASNEDLVLFFPSGPQGGIPRGVSAPNVYSFAPMSPAELAVHMQTGRSVAEEELRSRGGGGDPGAGAGPLCGDEVWVLHDFIKGHKMGEAVAAPMVR
ncbi:prfA [Symbiodinium sp. CCMP2592]|nr:prfA [Symbiodinium sp. CCMP2592]CAE7235819.1 prfA [Symbiodinium sp. CCMP2592]